MPKEKSLWDEKLYKYSIKRYGRMTNIGFYKMFLTTKDFIHDTYTLFISKITNFSDCDCFIDYVKLFEQRLFNSKTASYRNITKKGQEFSSRFPTYNIETDWSRVEKDYFEETSLITLEQVLEPYPYIKKFYEGYKYVETAKTEGVSPVSVRERTLKEFKSIKNDINFNELVK